MPVAKRMLSSIKWFVVSAAFNAHANWPQAHHTSQNTTALWPTAVHVTPSW